MAYIKQNLGDSLLNKISFKIYPGINQFLATTADWKEGTPIEAAGPPSLILATKEYMALFEVCFCYNKGF